MLAKVPPDNPFYQTVPQIYSCIFPVKINLNFYFHTYQEGLEGLEPATLLKRRPWHNCFSVNFTKLLRARILQNICKRLLLYNSGIPVYFSISGHHVLKVKNKEIRTTTLRSFWCLLYLF